MTSLTGKKDEQSDQSAGLKLKPQASQLLTTVCPQTFFLDVLWSTFWAHSLQFDQERNHVLSISAECHYNNKINFNEPHFSVNYVHTVFIELQLVNLYNGK